MNRDKKILLGLSIFICSVVAITIIKSTYAYPSTMENTGGGTVVPLGGDGGPACYKCASGYVQGSADFLPVGETGCVNVGFNSNGVCAAEPVKPSPSPSKKPITPSPSPSVRPSSSPWVKLSPSPTPNSYCYVCSTDDSEVYWGPYPVPSNISSSCNGTWNPTAKTQDECKAPASPSPSPTPNSYCYVCSTDDSEVYWGPYPVPSNISSSCNGTWNPTAKTQDECKAPASPSPSSTPNSYCYVCSTDDNKFYWGIYPVPSSISSSCSGTWKGTARTQEQCHAGDIPSNPNTGDVMLYIAYLIGFSSLFYSGYSFYRYKKQNNK